MTPVAPILRLRVLGARVARRLRSAFSGPRTPYVAERVAEYRGYWSEAATTLGATFEEIAPGMWEVGRKGRRTRIANFVTQCDDPVILRLAGDKPFCLDLATSVGVPVPEHRVVTLATLNDATRLLEETGFPVVVKPAEGSSSGLGVSTGVRTRRELVGAAALASLFGERILIERMVAGESYRLLYLGGELIHAVRRRGFRVGGDGRRTVAALLDGRRTHHDGRDLLVERTLSLQGLASSSVPPAGREVLVDGIPAESAGKAELRTIYDEAAVALCGPELVREGANVVRALGSEFAGVDVITTDPSVSLRASGGAFIEVNTTPGIHHHYVVQRGSPVPVAVTVLTYLLDNKGVA